MILKLKLREDYKVFVDLVLLSTYNLRTVYVLVNITIRLKLVIKLFV